MNNHDHDKSAADSVLDAIKSGKVSMRPRWHFVLRTTLYAVGTILAALSVVYTASFIVFALRATGVWFAPHFGSRGIGIFLFSLPHVLIVLAFVFIVLLEWLVRKYAFAYRQPLLYSALAVVALVVVGGAVVAQTSLHEMFYRHVRAGDLPLANGPAGGFYRMFAEAHFGDVRRGTVVSASEDAFMITDRQGRAYTVLISPETSLPSGANFGPGDEVVVLGEETGPEGSTTIAATGVEKLPPMPSDAMNSTSSGPRFYVHFTPR